jgi:hypothetical protein
MLMFEFGAAMAGQVLVRCTKKSLTSSLHVPIISLCGATKQLDTQTSKVRPARGRPAEEYPQPDALLEVDAINLNLKDDHVQRN